MNSFGKKFILLGVLTLLLMPLGCCKYALYGPMVDTAKWSGEGGLNLALMAVAKKAGKGFHRRGAYEYELAQNLMTHIESDVSTKQLLFEDLLMRPEYKLVKPANLKPAKISFVDRARVSNLLDEQDFAQTDRVDEATASKIGKIAGAKAIMFISCSFNKSGKKEEQAYETIRVKYKDYERTKGGVIKRHPGGAPVKVIWRYRYIQRPKKIGNTRIVKISQSVQITANVRMIEVATSKVLYSKVAKSRVFVVSTEVREGQPVKLNLKAAAEASLKSLGHKIGRLFYPIVSRGCMGSSPADPRKTSSDSLGNDLTWD